MAASVRHPSNSNLNKQIKKLASETEDLPTYNIFKIIASICNACVSKICEYLPTPSLPTSAKTYKRKPCQCIECIGHLNHIENSRIELRLLYENKCRNELDHEKCKNNNCKPCPAHNCSNVQTKSITHTPWQQMPGKNPTPRSRQIDLRQLSQLGMLEKPIEKYLIIQGKHVDIHEPICDKLLYSYICGRCECKNKPHLEQYLGDDLEPQKQKCTGSSVCKCSLCECLFCPLQKEATFAESVESFKRNFVGNEWKGRLRDNEQEIQACRTAKDFRHFRDCTKIIVDKSSDEKYFAKCSKHDHGRKPCQHNTLQQQRMFSKMPVKEMLDNLYTYDRDFEIEENDKNVSNVNPNQMLTDQLLKNKYGVYTTQNETNTENFTADKCIETDNLSANKKQCVEKKVKNYEYTLKIEIITPNFDDNTKQAMKQRIKRSSKNKIKEQTQKIMKDVIKDISKNSLMHDMNVPENTSTLQLSDSIILGDTESQERNKRRSILKKNSPVSVTSTTVEKQDSLQMITALPRRKGSKIEDFIVSCVTPLQNTNRNTRTGRVLDANKSEIPSKDEPDLSQTLYTCNLWSDYTKRAYSALRVQYNHAFRGLLGLPWRCSASGMFAAWSTDGFQAVLRKRVASLAERVRGSANALLKVIAGRMDSHILAHWMSMHISPVPPALPSMMTPVSPVDEVEKLISFVDAPATDVKVRLGEKSSLYLDDLRVQEPSVRRVSHHTVSLKWKLPKLMEEIMGYEILVDGRTIEKILNPKRCLAVVSCLPPVQRLMITIRTLPKNPDLHGLYPCTTIGYQPRANKFIRI